MAEQAKPSNKIFTIPNILSLLRILTIPLFAWAYLNDHYIVALSVVIFAGLSDTLDGKIARAFNQVSEFGKILDPLADKLSQGALAVLLFIKFSGSSNVWMQRFAFVFILFVVKELLMLLVALIMLLMKLLPAPAAIWGKTATVVFYVVMGIMFFAGPDVGVLAHYFNWALPVIVVQALVVLALVLTFVAFFSYFPDTVRKVVGKYKKGAKEETEEQAKN